MARHKYTPEQLAFLRRGYRTMNTRGLTPAFNARFGLDLTEAAIKSTLKRHRIRSGRTNKDRLMDRTRILTEAQEAFLRREYRSLNRAKLTAALNNRFNTSFTVEQISGYVKRYKIKSGRTGCFKKNHKTWNAGTKGQGLTGPNRGTFKKGNAPSNRKPLGSERICTRTGAVLIKVAEPDPYTGFPTRYKHKHVHNWEQNFGPVPEGKVVALRDGNPLNCEPENLMLITRAELLNLNRNGYRRMPDELKPSVLALSRLQVKAHALEKEAG